MRETLFRGKRIDNGKWVYGYYCKSPITDGNSEGDASDGWYFLSGKERHLIIQDGVAFTVDPETIGQYTGLDDKNGGKIFGGDIVMVNGDADDCGEVLWDEDDLCYEININGWLTRLGEYCSRELEVIDNPEFLEVNNVKP